MELVKDIIKAFISGIIEYKAENIISEKRKSYFSHKGGKWEKICFWGSLILVFGFLIVGLYLIFQKKIIGALLLCISVGISLFMIVDWASAEN